MVGIIFHCMDGFVLSVFEGRYLGSFDRTGDDVSGPYGGLGVKGNMTAYEIYAMKLNDSSHVSRQE